MQLRSKHDSVPQNVLVSMTLGYIEYHTEHVSPHEAVNQVSRHLARDSGDEAGRIA